MQEKVKNPDAFRIYEATVKLLSSFPPEQVDALFFYSRSFGDDTGLFELAEELYTQNLINIIALFGNEGERVGSSIPFESNPGKTFYTMRLKKLGIPENRIFYTGPAFHTREENDAFLNLAIDRGWKSAVILAQPHQIVRIMLGLVQAMQRKSYWMKVFTAHPKYTPWLEIVMGSQGLEEKMRFRHIEDECNRIFYYIEQGNIATLEQLEDYLQRRESGNL